MFFSISAGFNAQMISFTKTRIIILKFTFLPLLQGTYAELLLNLPIFVLYTHIT